MNGLQSHPNIWGTVPEVIEMQSEGGAAGTVHGALQTGALTTTFTASQGLMLMLPNIQDRGRTDARRISHVAARSLAAQGLSIFGDHQDVMAARTTGFAMLGSASTGARLCADRRQLPLRSRIPVVHFFDGFRTSHEVNKLVMLSEDDMKAMLPDELVIAHRGRALNPDKPLSGYRTKPDVYFRA